MKASKRRIEANRANAKKSTGPKTAEGKAISSRNAVSHGLCATSFVIDNEKLDDYKRFRDEYIARYAPRDVVEVDLVDRMVHSSWNLRRTWTMQNELLNLEMFRMRGSLDKEFAEIPEHTRTVFAFEKVAEKPTLSLLNRYEARQSGEYQRALKTLLDLKKYVPLAPPGPTLRDEPTEPEPPANQSPATNPAVDPTEPPTAPPELATSHWPLATNHGPLVTNQPLTTVPKGSRL
jgi:hypothetical protein